MDLLDRAPFLKGPLSDADQPVFGAYWGSGAGLAFSLPLGTKLLHIKFRKDKIM